MDGLDFLRIILYRQCIHQVEYLFFSLKINLMKFLVGSPETNVDTDDNRHDFIDKFQRLKQQVVDGFEQERDQNKSHIIIARTIFTSDTSTERRITVGNWTFQCNGPTQLTIHNIEGEQVYKFTLVTASFTFFF